MMARVEVVIVNLTAKARDATLHGRPYKVAPATMIVPGVLPGSQGPLLYTADETRRNPDSWNGMPLLLGHPVENGTHVSGRSPAVWERQGLGHIYETSADEAGRLRAEAWFDVGRTRALAPDVLAALEAGTPVELSTGLYLDSEPAAPGATHNGQAYGHVARNFRPDHLAVLVGEKGACSVEQGCGILANAEDRGLFRKFFDWLKGGASAPTGNAWSEAAREAAIEARKAHAKGSDDKGGKGKQGGKADEKGGHVEATARFDDATAGKVADAFEFSQSRASEGSGDLGGMGSAYLPELHARLEKATGQKVSPEEFRGLVEHLHASGAANIQQINEVRSIPPKDHALVMDRNDRAYGLMIIKDQGKLKEELGKYGRGELRLPKTRGLANNSAATRNSEETVMDKKALVSWLTANCDCWKGSEAVLNGMSEDALKRIKADADKVRTLNVIVANKKGARRAVVNADGVADGEVAPGINIGDLAKFLGVETDPGQDPAGFIRDILAKLDEIEQRLGDEPEPPESPDDATPADVAPTAMSATPTGNRKGKPMGMSEYLRLHGTDDDRAVWNTAREIEQAERRRLVQQIVANGDYATEQERKADFAELMREPIGSLRKQIRRLGRQAREQPEPVANYFGASGVADAPAQTEEDARDYLPVPTVNYVELADARK